MLDRQPDQVRRLLLRTSVLERVNGELADRLSGDSGGQAVLQDLEEANAFVVSLDAARSWFRYHHLFADLLQLELRRTEPGQAGELHTLAARWFADRGFPVEAVRHAQAAGDWELATRLLADHWPSMYVGGQDATVHALMTAFPGAIRAANAELAALAAADELAAGSMEAGEQYLRLAEREAAALPASRRGHAQVLVAVARLFVAGRSGDQRARAEEARRLLAAAQAPKAARPGLGEELAALALLEIGDAETWSGRLDEAQAHLERAISLARRIGRPYLEFMGLTYRAEIELNRSFPRAEELCRQAIEVAERHGWTDDLFMGFASMTIGSALTWQGRLDEAEDWVRRAELTFRAEANPAAAMGGYYVRGQLELARGQFAGALDAFRAAERLAGPHPLARPLRAWLVFALAGLGQTEQAEQVLAGLRDRGRDRAEMRVADAVLRLAQDDPQAASAALAPILENSARPGWRSWEAAAFLLEAIARDTLGDPGAAGRALERALGIAEPDSAVLWFLTHPAQGLLERHARQPTAHAALIARLLDMMARNGPAPPAGPRPPLEPVSNSELRVLRYLPTHLSAAEIAHELSVSTSTVKTHMRNLYAKLGAHRRAEAIAQARALGLLAPSGRAH